MFSDEQKKADDAVHKMTSDSRKAYETTKALYNVSVGKMVEVVKKGRTPVEVGTTGRIFWAQYNDWGTLKVGLKDDAGTVYWTTVASVVVTDPTIVADFPATKIKARVTGYTTDRAWNLDVEGRTKAIWCPKNQALPTFEDKAGFQDFLVANWVLAENNIKVS